MRPSLREANGMRPLPVDLDAEIHVAVFEENEILRRGLAVALAEDRALRVTASDVDEPEAEDVDVAIVSREVAATKRLRCPIIVYSDDPRSPPVLATGNRLAGVLRRDRLTGAQLRATVRAAAAGLVISERERGGLEPELDARSTQVLEMIAGGCSTREIAEHMAYSERTIKKLIMGLQDRFDARSRPQVVAEAIRRGLI
jgi:DNA-binding NarL/FixJ family response regulator